MVVSTVTSNGRRFQPGARLLGAQGARLLGAFSSIVLSVAFSACAGSSHDDDHDASNGVSPGDFAEKAASAICGNLTDCCLEAGFTLERAACTAYVEGVIDNTSPAGTTWDSEAAGRCLEALASVARACDASAGETEYCTRIRRGTLPEGAACTDDAQCADIGGELAWCDSDGMSSGTVCMAPIPVLRGAVGDACDGTCTDRSCTRLALPGTTALATCFVEDGVVCDFDLGECVPAPGVGEPCPSYYCASGAHCPDDAPVCAATKPNGSSCEGSDECSEGTCINLVCTRPSVASQALCTGQ